MAKLPLRVLGLMALAIAVTFASCSAFVRSATDPAEPPSTEHGSGRTP